MKLQQRIARLAIVMFSCSAVFAHGAVIDFEGATIGVNQTTDYLEDGFRMSVQNGEYAINPNDAFIGSGNYLALERTAGGSQQSTVRIDLGGSLFDFVSLESSSFGGRINFSDGTSELFGDFPLLPGETQIVTYAGRTNLSWIELSSRSNDFLRVDNIDLAESVAVPEPSSLGLFALAILALRRTRTA